jgi:uncharacterized protein (TIGR02001 family)
VRAPGVFLLLCFVAFHQPASAQVSGQVALLSDYRQRGVSLSDTGPSIQATVNYDHGSGFFAGAMASRVRIVSQVESRSGGIYDAYGVYVSPVLQRYRISRSGAGTQLYAGYAGTLSEALSWEAGVIDYRFPRVSSAPDYDYVESFIGLGLDRINFRLYRSNDYYGVGARMTYLEANLSQPLTELLSLSAHVGHQGLRTPASHSSRMDYRLGFGARVFPEAVVEFAVVGTSLRGSACPVSGQGCSRRATLSIAHSF